MLATIIASQGWRSADIVLAAIAIMVWPFVLFGFRNVAGTAPSKEETVEGADRTHAVKSRIFWTISFGFVAVATAVSGTVVHVVPLLRDAGLALPKAAATAYAGSQRHKHFRFN